MTKKFGIVEFSGNGAALAAEVSGNTLPIGSFRDFYAFENHVKTARERRGLEMIPQWYEFPVFYFSNHQALLANGQQLETPSGGSWLDFELEIGCVIGKGGKNISADKASEHILGYTVLNDWSLRDVQREEVKVGLGPAKGKDFATSLGSHIIPKEALAAKKSKKGYDLSMTARVNGVEVSRGNWSEIHYSFEEMISRASADVEIFPGDLIGSGTVGTGCILELGPEEVGFKLQRVNGWLEAGDVVELEVEMLGKLETRIISYDRRTEGV